MRKNKSVGFILQKDEPYSPKRNLKQNGMERRGTLVCGRPSDAKHSDSRRGEEKASRSPLMDFLT